MNAHIPTQEGENAMQPCPELEKLIRQLYGKEA